ncbi:MotA/TolQ/ExbB proton channel family protein [Haliea sp. AH-315-K21]|uniref:Energy transducer TonB n=1 Tax=SAR86 cluster bacterium TaxID=2030880 RepID=A0A2A5CEK0_9GAMM|nr:MotA/TolQ/ExbB proton channel family protein [Haliea sp. AH-315-K21]MBN4075214.1 MotA/TolQ/ExbB proton channel family protein [Gammaproteobacteria bacterium AH-315-E17]PCJ42163.1 MAG: energy transducer TonB [SAR86 cluster bacterium]
MKLIKTFGLTLASAAICFTSFQAGAQDSDPRSLDELLQLVESATLTETQEQRDRVARFEGNVNQRQQILNDMVGTREEEEAISGQLENTYDENEILKAQRNETLQERIGDLDELFGTIAGVVGDTRSNFEQSLISAQFDGREEFLTELAGIMASDSQLPSIVELERLWFYLQQEMTESARIAKFDALVAGADGSQTTREVVRIGSYNIVSNGEYLEYDSTTGRLSVLPAQPSGGILNSGVYQNQAADFQNSTSGFTRLGIDPTGPTGGSYLAALISSPDFRTRYGEEGGEIGSIIIVVGAIAMLFAIYKMVYLTIVGAKVNSQLRNAAKPNKNNPLGRVLMIYENDKAMDIETLELKLGEAILQETPALERFLTLVKIISTVAPLMGLLGTVTGMIEVFQQITLFGTGDPQIMAGGISSALVTTVLGISVAIPTVLIHTLIKSRSDRILFIMEEQATGIIARKAENTGSNA